MTGRIGFVIAVCLASRVAGATHDDPRTAAKWGLSDDETADKMRKVVAAKLEQMIGKPVSIELQDTEGTKGKCHDEAHYPRSVWRKQFTHLLSAMQFMTEDEVGKATVKKVFKGFRWVCYTSSTHDNIELKDGILIVTGDPTFLGFTQEGTYGRRRYHQFKEETTRFGDDDVGDTLYAIYDDDSQGTSISYERAAKYARNVMIPTYDKKLSQLLGGPVSIEIDFAKARCTERKTSDCGNPYGQQDKLLIDLFNESAGIPAVAKGFEEAFTRYADDHDASKIAASKKALLKQVRKIRFSWRDHGNEDGNGRVDFKLEGGVLTILPGWKTNYLQDRRAVSEFLKTKIPGFLP